MDADPARGSTAILRVPRGEAITAYYQARLPHDLPDRVINRIIDEAPVANWVALDHQQDPGVTGWE